MDAVEGRFELGGSQASVIGGRAHTDARFGTEGKPGGTLTRREYGRPGNGGSRDTVSAQASDAHQRQRLRDAAARPSWFGERETGGDELRCEGPRRPSS